MSSCHRTPSLLGFASCAFLIRLLVWNSHYSEHENPSIISLISLKCHLRSGEHQGELGYLIDPYLMPFQVDLYLVNLLGLGKIYKLI